MTDWGAREGEGVLMTGGGRGLRTGTLVHSIARVVYERGGG